MDSNVEDEDWLVFRFSDFHDTQTDSQITDEPPVITNETVKDIKTNANSESTNSPTTNKEEISIENSDLSSSSDEDDELNTTVVNVGLDDTIVAENEITNKPTVHQPSPTGTDLPTPMVKITDFTAKQNEKRFSDIRK